MLLLFYGSFRDMIARAKDAGIVTIVQVGTVRLAEEAIAHGADMIIAQGAEGGSHLNRGTIGILSLLPAIASIAGHRPVLAAGGITNRSDVKAVLKPGTSGIWVGTAFVATHECLAHDLYKQLHVDSTVDDTKYC